MTHTRPFSRFQPVLLLAGFYLFLACLLRLVLWKIFGPEAGVTWGDLPDILVVGMANDLVVLVFLCLPATLLLALLPERWIGSRWLQRLAFLALVGILFGLLYLMQVEFFFFQEFNARFNLVAVDYLIYPHEVLVNIWESYPVVRVLLADLLLALLLARWSWPVVQPALAGCGRLRHRLVGVGSNLLLVVPALLLSTGSFDSSANRVVNELSHNGLSSLFRAFHTNQLDFLSFYRSLDSERAFQLVREAYRGDGQFVNDDPRDLSRQHAARPEGLGRMNVVVIVEESLSASFSGLFGREESLTPNLDRLSREGLLFTRAYASGTRTVRGLEAISTSFLPIPSEAIVKRPGSEHIANWGEVMRANGYQSSFLYGGYGSFDNMNHFFSENGFTISDRTDIANPAFSNIWGVSDGDLFRHALAYYDRQSAAQQPFFSIIMTTSNHRPYTFPAGIPDIPPEGGGRSAGVRYADHALGEFFTQASRHEWFGRTLFVVVADHCARVYGRAEIPVATYHIPLLLYAPGVLLPGRVDRPIGQIDIAPTVLGLLGLPYTAPFYGRDVLHESLAPGEHPLFLNHNHDVAMLVGDRLAVLGLQDSAALFRYDWDHDRQSLGPDDPQLFDRVAAYYQSAFELFVNHRYQ